jgi:hypothetical protein
MTKRAAQIALEKKRQHLQTLLAERSIDHIGMQGRTETLPQPPRPARKHNRG